MDTAVTETGSAGVSSFVQLIVDNFYVQVAAMVLGAIVVIFILAMAYWVFRDIKSRTDNRLGWLLSVLAILVLNILGLIFYLLLRPQKTLEENEMEEMERRLLEEEGLDFSDETIECRKCHKEISESHHYCPHCGTETHPHCANCGAAVRKNWEHCPECGKKLTASKKTKEK